MNANLLARREAVPDHLGKERGREDQDPGSPTLEQPSDFFPTRIGRAAGFSPVILLARLAIIHPVRAILVAIRRIEQLGLRQPRHGLCPGGLSATRHLGEAVQNARTCVLARAETGSLDLGLALHSGEDRVAGQRCRICSEPIKPGESVSFQDSELVHMTCYSEQSRPTPRRAEASYKGHSIRLMCYPILGRWRASIVVETPGRIRSTQLGRMNLRDTAQEALAFGLKAATDWIDKSAAEAGHGRRRDESQ